MKLRRMPNLHLRAPATRGAALFVFALVLSGVLIGGFFLVRQGPTLAKARDRATSEALGRAKEALIGFRCHLPRPDRAPESGLRISALPRHRP